MKRKSDNDIVREYICEVLKSQMNEDSFGGDFYDSSMYSGGLYGGGGGGGDMGGLYKAFVKPFTDVIGTAVGKTKELARRAVTVVQVAFETIMTTLIPFLEDSYDEIFAAEKSDIQGIKSEYSQYYQATEEALRGPGATLLAFMAFPQAALLHRSVEDGPGAIKKVLSVATGGTSDKYLGGGGGGGRGGPKSSGIFDSYSRNKSLKLFLEDEKESKGKKKSDKENPEENPLVKKIRNKEFISSVMQKSEVMGPASEEAKQIYRKTLKTAYEQANGVITAKSIDEIEKATGKKLKGKEELNKLKGDERKKAEDEMLKAVKQSAKKLYITKLQSQVKPVRDRFGDDFPFVKDYDTVIQKINSL